MLTLETVREVALALPGVEEGTSYGTPAFKVKGKLLARLWDNAEVLVVKIGMLEREALLATEPDKYFITAHYANYPSVLVRLAAVDRDELREVLIDAWHQVAPRRLVAEFDRQ